MYAHETERPVVGTRMRVCSESKQQRKANRKQPKDGGNSEENPSMSEAFT